MVVCVLTTEGTGSWKNKVFLEIPKTLRDRETERFSTCVCVFNTKGRLCSNVDCPQNKPGRCCMLEESDQCLKAKCILMAGWLEY